MSTHNIGFYEEMAKIIFQLSSNMHFINFLTQDIHNLSFVMRKPALSLCKQQRVRSADTAASSDLILHCYVLPK